MQKDEFIEKLIDDSLNGDVAGLIRPEINYDCIETWDNQKSRHSIVIEIKPRSKRQIVNKTHRSLNEKHF